MNHPDYERREAPQIVYCPVCENPCSEAAPACPRCGHPLTTPLAALAQAVANPTQQTNPAITYIVDQRKSLWHGFWRVFLIAAAVVLGAFVAFVIIAIVAGNAVPDRSGPRNPTYAANARAPVFPSTQIVACKMFSPKAQGEIIEFMAAYRDAKKPKQYAIATYTKNFCNGYYEANGDSVPAQLGLDDCVTFLADRVYGN